MSFNVREEFRLKKKLVNSEPLSCQGRKYWGRLSYISPDT